MVPTGYYVGKERLLHRRLAKTLKRFGPQTEAAYGIADSRRISARAVHRFTELIPRIPHYDTASYRNIILVNAQLVAIVRAFGDAGKPAADALHMQADIFREDFRYVPRLAGRLFTSSLGGYLLKDLARKVTREGWDTEVVRGNGGNSFDVSVITRRCGVVGYLESEGMTDVLPYCAMSDFLMFPAMGIGLKQASTIDRGACVYHMKYGGTTEIPPVLYPIYDRKPQQGGGNRP